jgi:hypothetical protein
MIDQSDREDDLFPIATPAWIRHRARARRIARKALYRRLRAEGAINHAGHFPSQPDQWTEDYFQSHAQQDKLF